MKKWILICFTFAFCASCLQAAAADTLKIGLNYPKSGNYREQGLQQLQGATMALDEINAAGGILGKQVELVTRNTSSNPEKGVRNVQDMVRNHGVTMVFGGASSAVAIASGKKAQELDVIYFGTLTYSNSTTGREGHTHMFRETYNAWMAAKVLAQYLNKEHSGKKMFYLTADYDWGWSTEESFRLFTNTTDTEVHPGVRTPFPRSRRQDFQQGLARAEASGAEVLVMVLFGNDMVTAVSLAHKMGLKNKMAIIVPNMTLGMVRAAGPYAIEGVVGAVPWAWNIPYINNYQRGQQFVEKFSQLYGSYPSSSAASAYAILYQYKDAVERAGSVRTAKVIKSLEGHHYTLLKGRQLWRAFDHQNIQTVYAVRGQKVEDVLNDRFNLDYFEVIDALTGAEAAKTHKEWLAARKEAKRPKVLN